MIYAAIVAGGTGSRMGAAIPKQFLEIDGRVILALTLKRFLTCKKIDMVYIGVHPDWKEYTKEICKKNGLDLSRIKIIEGGADRTETVSRITHAISAEREISDDDIIVTHDGVRPFVTLKEIEDSIDSMNKIDGVTVCLPATDTMLYSEDGGFISSVPQRSKMFRALTPQTFRLKRLIEAYNSLSVEQKNTLTDTASVFTSAGLPVGLIIGNSQNIKITTPLDMKIALSILNDKNK